MWPSVFATGGLFSFFTMGSVLCGGSFVVGTWSLSCLTSGALAVDVGTLLAVGDAGNKSRSDLTTGVLIVGVGGAAEVVWPGKRWNHSNL